MITLLLILGAALAIVASGFFSGTEMGVYALNGVRLRVQADQGDRGARRLLPLMDRYEDLVITTLLGTNVADYFASACVTAALLRALFVGAQAELYATLILTPAILVFGNVIPKERFRREADRLMYACAMPLTFWTRLVRWTGLPAVLRGLARALLRRLDPARAAERDVLPQTRVLELLREGAARGGLTAFQRDAFERVMSLSRTPVTRVMVPRQRAAMIGRDWSRTDVLRVARMAHFSRLPVYVGDPRHVVGVLNVFDVLADDRVQPTASYVRDVQQLAVSETVMSALRTLQRTRQGMAIVCDARGQCVGLLTIKDLVEEIVGELEAW